MAGIGLLAVLLIGGAVWGLRTSSFNWLIGSQTKAASTNIVQSMADLNADGARVPPPSGNLKSVTTVEKTLLDGDASIGIAAPNPADVHLKTVSMPIEPASAAPGIAALLIAAGGAVAGATAGRGPTGIADPHETTGDGISVVSIGDPHETTGDGISADVPPPGDYDRDGFRIAESETSTTPGSLFTVQNAGALGTSTVAVNTVNDPPGIPSAGPVTGSATVTGSPVHADIDGDGFKISESESPRPMDR